MNLRNRETSVRPRSFQKLSTLDIPDPFLSIKGLNLEIGEHAILKDINIEIKPGELLAIVGEVGSGKSLLLLSLMGETGATFREYNIGENDARKLPLDQLRQFFTFVPQEGFIMSASLRENVVFDYSVNHEFDEEIKKSLRRAQFDPDKENISKGLETEIGERGVNLSGGQKQRVSLARVDFVRSPIVLLDDCLSAVDVDTERHMIDDLIKGSWKNRTRILVTHRLTVLKEVDRILFLEKGAVKAQGTFTELMQASSAFRDYTASVARGEAISNPPDADSSLSLTEVLDESERSSDSV